MKALDQFLIPLHRVKEGLHKFEYELDRTFFAVFEDALIDESLIQTQIVIDRKTDLMILELTFRGYMVTECDRCAEMIKLPLEGEEMQIIKFGEIEDSDDETVTYIPAAAEELNLAPLLYEVISLSIPMVKRYDCEDDPDKPCDSDVLNYLSREQSEGKDTSVWDELKKLDL